VGQFEICSRLLGCGRKRNGRGILMVMPDTTLEGTTVDATDRHGNTPLMLAARDGHLDAVRVLIERGANLNVTAKYGLSALMLAIVRGHAEVAQTLINAGADLGIRGRGAIGFEGKTALDLAEERGMVDLARLLGEVGH
jgi:uncharacterized protein